MNKRFLGFTTAAALLFGGVAIAQYPMMDMVANNLVQKYQNSSCEQLWQERAMRQGRPKPQQEQDLIALLHSDAQMRAAFIGKVAAPIVNKEIECGMNP